MKHTFNLKKSDEFGELIVKLYDSFFHELRAGFQRVGIDSDEDTFSDLIDFYIHRKLGQLSFLEGSDLNTSVLSVRGERSNEGS